MPAIHGCSVRTQQIKVPQKTDSHIRFLAIGREKIPNLPILWMNFSFFIEFRPIWVYINASTLFQSTPRREAHAKSKVPAKAVPGYGRGGLFTIP
jgi:hypothetical protein